MNELIPLFTVSVITGFWSWAPSLAGRGAAHAARRDRSGSGTARAAAFVLRLPAGQL